MTTKLRTLFLLYKRRILPVFLCLAVLLPQAGCSSPGKSNNRFSYSLGGTVKSLDPQTALGPQASLVIGTVFEGLCRLDTSNRPLPGAARAWISDVSCTRYVFFLKQDGRWSNGEPVTAEDFVFGLQRALAPETRAGNLEDLFIIENAREISEGALPPEELGVTALDDYTLSFVLESSDPNFPAATALPRFMPCNREFFESTSGRYGLGAQYLLTNGPFTFSNIYSWVSGVSIELSRCNYYHGTVLPMGVTFTMDAETSIDPLLRGERDLVSTDKVSALKAMEAGCTVYSFENGTTGLLFNTSDEYLSDIGLRELFVKTIDRGALLRDLPEGVEPADEIMPDCIMWGQTPYNEAARRGLLVEEDDSVTGNLPGVLSGLGQSTVPSLTVICPDDSLSVDLVNRLIANWNEKMGSYFNILPLDPDSFSDRIYSGDYQIAFYTPTASGTTPFSFLRAFESISSPRLLDSESYDEMLHSAGQVVEDYVELEETLQERYIFYPILRSNTYYALAPGVTGMAVSMNGLDFTSADK